MTMDTDDGQQDVNICRICRSEGTHDRPLFYPCLCHGSIKFIHQECLVQWLRYSRKDICELCNHKFTFLPIYSPDMPKRLPIKDIFSGLATSIITALRYWIHYSLVGFSWLGIVPLSACRIHRSLFSGSLNSLLTLPLDLLSTDNILADIFHGCIVVACTLSIFISLIWLREHLQHGNAPPWLDPQPQQEEENPEVQQPPDENNLQEGGVVEENAGPGIENVEGGNNIAEPGIENNNQRVAENNANNDDLGNWNPMEWDRAAEELTWERLLGLDGSLVFLEHVFWVVSLNTLFILVFEFVPYHIGHGSLMILKMENLTKSHFEGLLTTIIGYIVIGISLVFLHFFASLLRLKKSKKIVGVCYVIVKVCILSCVEIGIFPLICGWWLDICSLSLFDATLKDREASFTKAPGTSFFMHWLFGMIYVFYFASFVLLLREVLRPGVLWFLRNLNDPDFNPIQEMIHLTIFRHIRRFLFSIIIFGTTVLLMVWLPVRMIKRFWPSFLPFTFVFTTEQTHELSLELILLQVIMPALLEQGHSREWLKKIIRWWCMFISWVLDLKNYLLAENDNVAENENEPQPQADENNPVPGVVNPDPVENPIQNPQINPEEIEVDDEHREQEVIVQQPLPQGPLQQQLQQQPIVEEPVGLGFGLGALGQAHQQLLLRDGPAGFKSYIRPDYFPLKIAILIMAMCLSLTFVSILIITVPVTLGRYLMALWISKSDEPIHELYTTFTGLYVSLLLIRLLVILINWIPRGWANFANTIKRWSITALKAIIVLTLLVAVIPYLSGLLVELLVITPLRVPINQTPLYSASENWIMGTLYVKIVCAIAMMSPQNFWLRRCLERIYQDGLRNIRLNFILKDLAAPFIFALGFTLSLPYVISHSIVPLFVTNFETQNLVKRRIYPYFLIVICFGLILYFQMSQFKKLLQSIKNDKYLVGRRLVNYERPPPAPIVPAPIVQQPQHPAGVPAEE